MNKEDLRNGDRVRFTGEGVLQFDRVASGYGNQATVKRDDGYRHSIRLDQITEVLSRDPENWPVRLNDVWEAEGELYYVRKHGFEDDIVVAPFDRHLKSYSDSYRSNASTDNFKELKPVLKYRRP